MYITLNLFVPRTNPAVEYAATLDFEPPSLSQNLVDNFKLKVCVRVKKRFVNPSADRSDGPYDAVRWTLRCVAYYRFSVSYPDDAQY